MKKKIIIAIIALGITVNTGIHAQGYPVMDITSIIAAIENGYTMYQQLQTMYSTLKTSYDQLKQQIKSFESFDFRQLDARDPLGSWQSINTYASRMMTYEDNIESIIKRKDIKIGNGSYSLSDIFTTPPNQTVKNMAIDGISFTAIDPFENRLSPQEKAAFHQKYGMSIGHHMRLSQLGDVLQKKAAEVVGYSNSLQENLAEDRMKLDEIAGNVFGSESTVQQQQITNTVMTIMTQDLKTVANVVGDIAQQVSAYFSHAMIEKQAIQDEINMNSLNIADGFLNMLNEIDMNNYR